MTFKCLSVACQVRAQCLARSRSRLISNSICTKLDVGIRTSKLSSNQVRLYQTRQCWISDWNWHKKASTVQGFSPLTEDIKSYLFATRFCKRFCWFEFSNRDTPMRFAMGERSRTMHNVPAASDCYAFSKMTREMRLQSFSHMLKSYRYFCRPGLLFWWEYGQEWEREWKDEGLAYGWRHPLGANQLNPGRLKAFPLGNGAGAEERILIWIQINKSQVEKIPNKRQGNMCHTVVIKVCRNWYSCWQLLPNFCGIWLMLYVYGFHIPKSVHHWLFWLRVREVMDQMWVEVGWVIGGQCGQDWNGAHHWRGWLTATREATAPYLLFYLSDVNS